MIKVTRQITFLKPQGGMIDTNSIYNDLTQAAFEDMKKKILSISTNEHVEITITGKVERKDQVSLTYSIPDTASEELKLNVQRLFD